jgi:hypothetical protein
MRRRPRPQIRSLGRLLAGLSALAALGACGSGYVQQIDDDPAPEPARAAVATAPAAPPVALATPLPPPSAAAEVVADARDLPTLERNHRNSLIATAPADMARHAFRVRLVDGLNDATQLIHCSTGKVIRFEKRAPSPGLLEARTRAGIPAGEWVLEVDPSGARADLPNNDWYRHIAKFHRLEFIERDRTSGTVIYRYLGPRAGLSGQPGT